MGMCVEWFESALKPFLWVLVRIKQWTLNLKRLFLMSWFYYERAKNIQKWTYKNLEYAPNLKEKLKNQFTIFHKPQIQKSL